MMHDNFWVYNPIILFKRTEIIPRQGMSRERRLNALTRLVILITVVIFILFKRDKKRLLYCLIFIISSLSVIILIYITDKNSKIVYKKRINRYDSDATAKYQDQSGADNTHYCRIPLNASLETKGLQQVKFQNMGGFATHDDTKSKTEFFICNSKRKIYTYKGFKQQTKREINICASKKR